MAHTHTRTYAHTHLPRKHEEMYFGKTLQKRILRVFRTLETLHVCKSCLLKNLIYHRRIPHCHMHFIKKENQQYPIVVGYTIR